MATRVDTAFVRIIFILLVSGNVWISIDSLGKSLDKGLDKSIGYVRILSFNNAGVNPVFAENGRKSQVRIPGTGAHVFGLQEVASQAVPEFFGYTRFTGIWTGSEHLPIYFQADRFKLIGSLSHTLDIDVRDQFIYDGVVYGPFQRGFNAIRLRDTFHNKILVIINTHLGIGGSAPDQSDEVLALSESFREGADVVVYLGDFNHDLLNPSEQIPPPGFLDSNCRRDLTPTKPVSYGNEEGAIIDYLFFKGSHVSAIAYRVAGEIYSDHYGVSADIKYLAGNCGSYP